MNDPPRRNDTISHGRLQLIGESTGNTSLGDPTQDRSSNTSKSTRINRRISRQYSSRPCPVIARRSKNANTLFYSPVQETLPPVYYSQIDEEPDDAYDTDVVDKNKVYLQKVNMGLYNVSERLARDLDREDLDDFLSEIKSMKSSFKSSKKISIKERNFDKSVSEEFICRIKKFKERKLEDIEAAKNMKKILRKCNRIIKEKLVPPTPGRNIPVPPYETKVREKESSYQPGKEKLKRNMRDQTMKQAKEMNDEVKVEPEVGVNRSPAVQHIDIWDFGDMINGKLEEVAADNPDSSSSDIIEEALGQVIQQDIEDDELCCLDIDDDERRSVTIRWKSNEVCCIDGDALMELLPRPQTWTRGIDGFKLFLDQKLNQIQNGSSDSSTLPSEDGDSDLINNLNDEAKPPRKVQQRAPKRKSHRYPNYRILLQGKPWSESEESGEDEHARRNNPHKRSRVGQKRRKAHQCRLQPLHVMCSKSDVKDCPFCANVTQQRSDVAILTDCESDGPP